MDLETVDDVDYAHSELGKHPKPVGNSVRGPVVRLKARELAEHLDHGVLCALLWRKGCLILQEESHA